MKRKLTQGARAFGLLAIAVFGVFSILATGNGGGGTGGGTGGTGPTYRQYDCKAEDIDITATSSNRPAPGNQYMQIINANVTCEGNPANDADVKFAIWIGDPVKRTTNPSGNASWRHRAQADAGQPSYTLTVIGTDENGDPDPKSVNFTFNP